MDQKTMKQKTVHNVLYWGLPVLAIVLIAVGCRFHFLHITQI